MSSWIWSILVSSLLQDSQERESHPALCTSDVNMKQCFVSLSTSFGRSGL